MRTIQPRIISVATQRCQRNVERNNNESKALKEEE